MVGLFLTNLERKPYIFFGTPSASVVTIFLQSYFTASKISLISYFAACLPRGYLDSLLAFS